MIYRDDNNEEAMYPGQLEDKCHHTPGAAGVPAQCPHARVHPGDMTEAVCGKPASWRPSEQRQGSVCDTVVSATKVGHIGKGLQCSRGREPPSPMGVWTEPGEEGGKELCAHLGPGAGALASSITLRNRRLLGGGRKGVAVWLGAVSRERMTPGFV